MVIPKSLQHHVVAWHQHYLMHPGHTRLIETISVTMNWRGLDRDCKIHVKTCDRCQKGKRAKRQYGKLPEKIPELIPWRTVCVDLIGPYTLKGKDRSLHVSHNDMSGHRLVRNH